MKQKKIAHYFFAAILLILFYLCFLILKPYATYILLALVLAFSFYPTYKKTIKITKNPNLTATLMILLILILIVLPLIFVATSIIDQAGSAYRSYNSTMVESFSNEINSRFNTNIDLTVHAENLVDNVISFIIKNVVQFVGGAADVFIGLFIMFVAMFYLFKQGHKTKEVVMQYLPLKKEYKEDLIEEVKNVTHAVVYSQVLVSLVQGTLLGISFAIFGFPNPIFWGFIGAILSFLPVVGAPIIWIPAGAIRLLSGGVGSAIGMIIFNAVITMNIDNIMRPRIVSHRSRLHPLITLVGIIGGLKLFGFIGILLGPMILALFTVLLRYFNKEF